MKSVRTKILVGFGLIVLLVLAMVVLIFKSFKQIDTLTDDMIEQEVPLLIVDENMAQNVLEQVAMIRGFFLLEQPQLKDELLETMEARQELTTDLLALTDSKEIEETLDIMEEWEGLLLEAIQEKEAGNDAVALDLIDRKSTRLNSSHV